MKKAIALLFLCFALSASALEQRVLLVPVADGMPNVTELNQLISKGWRVVQATPITDSDSVTLLGKPKQAFTTTVIYILQKE